MATPIIYTDGACSGNPGPGGWGFALVEAGEVLYSDAGKKERTTNNEMELTAAAKGIEHAFAAYPGEKVVTVRTDSAYTMNAMTSWVFNWRKNGWKNSKQQTVENLDLMKRLCALCHESGKKVAWEKVKAHQKPGSKHYDRFNEYADALATGREKPKK